MSSDKEKKQHRIKNKLKHSVRSDPMWHQRIVPDEKKYKRKPKYNEMYDDDGEL
jgi:hypothetical protein